MLNFYSFDPINFKFDFFSLKRNNKKKCADLEQRVKSKFRRCERMSKN